MQRSHFGLVIAEKDATSGHWSDYIFAADKRIARATNFEHQLHVSGVECASCGWQWYQFIVNNLGLAAGHTIQAADTLRWVQWSNTGSKGGIIKQPHFASNVETYLVEIYIKEIPQKAKGILLPCTGVNRVLPLQKELFG